MKSSFRTHLNKEGVFFSIDAVIAMSIIFIVIFLAIPVIHQEDRKVDLHYDLLSVLSSLNVNDFDHPYVQELKDDGLIADEEKSLLSQIGEFSLTNPEVARNLADAVFENIDTKENIGLWYGNKLVWSKNSTPIHSGDNIDVARTFISGLGEEGDVTGYSARSFLSSPFITEYFYLGGYVGEGNISSAIEYNGSLQDVKIEIAINKDFDLFVNGNYLGSYEGSPNSLTPVSYSLNESQLEHFDSGINIVEFRGEYLYISGGFIKTTYESEVQYQNPERYYFPGIKGIINLYDGIYIPGELESMNINLVMNSSFSKTFLTIGNTTVYHNQTDGNEEIYLDNSELSEILDYSSLSEKTIPLRLGIENVSFRFNQTIDLISVFDFSTAMACSVSGGNCGNNPGACSSCGGTWLLPLEQSKEAHSLLTDTISNFSGSQMGVVGYRRTVPSGNTYIPLTDDFDYIQSNIDEWASSSLGTDHRNVCLGIESMTEDFDSLSQSDIKVAIVMSAGDINSNVQCDSAGTSAAEKAINAACSAYEDHGIVVHSVGYGVNADEPTLQAIASCGNGTYYFSDMTGLSDLYQEIIGDIMAEYQMQTIEVIGADIYTELSPESYIEFEYTSQNIPFGLFISHEVQFFNSTVGSFEIPENSSIINAVVTSYSGPRWTDKVYVNDYPAFDLSYYGNTYISLGDPFRINLPNEFIESDDLNEVFLSTALSPQNSTVGSPYNKIIYTVVKNISAFSKVSAKADGCIWNVQFEDDSNVSFAVPDDYSGSEECYYAEEGYFDDVFSTPIYDENDAFQLAVYNLLKELDLNSNSRINVFFTEQDLEISLSSITGVPFTWSTEVQVRKWS